MATTAQQVRFRKNKNVLTPSLDETGDIPDEIEESLFLAPDGTMTNYVEGDEEDPNSIWFEHPPTCMSGSTELGVNDLPLNKE